MKDIKRSEIYDVDLNSVKGSDRVSFVLLE